MIYNLLEKIFVLDYFLIFISQIALFMFRTINVRHMAKGYELRSMISSVFYQTAWLFSVYIGVTNLMNGNFWIILFFLLGTVIGTKIGFRIK